MCNDYRQTVDIRGIEGEFSQLKIKLVFPDGVPNLEPRADIRITDRAPIVRAGDEAGTRQPRPLFALVVSSCPTPVASEAARLDQTRKASKGT